MIAYLVPFSVNKLIVAEGTAKRPGTASSPLYIPPCAVLPRSSGLGVIIHLGFVQVFYTAVKQFEVSAIESYLIIDKFLQCDKDKSSVLSLNFRKIIIQATIFIANFCI